MQFGWVSSTHSLSHATKLRKKSHEEIQLTTKTKTQIKALECFLQESCLEITNLYFDPEQQRKPKIQMKINSRFLIHFHHTSVSEILLQFYELKDNKKPNNPQEIRSSLESNLIPQIGYS
jgi:hypothetical protein